MTETNARPYVLDLDGLRVGEVVQPTPRDMRWARCAVARLLGARAAHIAEERYDAIINGAYTSIPRTEAAIRAIRRARRSDGLSFAESASLIAELLDLRLNWYAAVEYEMWEYDCRLDAAVTNDDDDDTASDTAFVRFCEFRCAVAGEYLRARGEPRLALMQMYEAEEFEATCRTGKEMLLDQRPARNAKRVAEQSETRGRAAA